MREGPRDASEPPASSEAPASNPAPRDASEPPAPAPEPPAPAPAPAAAEESALKGPRPDPEPRAALPKRAALAVLDFYWGEGIAYQAPALGFYILVSLAPLALGVVAIASLIFSDLITPERVAEELSNAYPVGVRDQVVELTRTVSEQSLWLLLFSISLMLWTSSAAIGVIERLMRSIAGAGPYPKIIWGRIRLIGLGALFAGLVCGSILIGATVGADVGAVGLFVGSLAASALILAVIYKLAPAIQLRVSSCLLGALPAALVLQLTPLAVSQYVKAGGLTISASGIFVSLGVLLTSCFILSQGILIGSALAARRG